MPSKNRESIRLVEETLSEEEQKYGVLKLYEFNYFRDI